MLGREASTALNGCVIWRRPRSYGVSHANPRPTGAAVVQGYGVGAANLRDLARPVSGPQNGALFRRPKGGPDFRDSIVCLREPSFGTHKGAHLGAQKWGPRAAEKRAPVLTSQRFMVALCSFLRQTSYPPCPLEKLLWECCCWPGVADSRQPQQFMPQIMLIEWPIQCLFGFC